MLCCAVRWQADLAAAEGEDAERRAGRREGPGESDGRPPDPARLPRAQAAQTHLRRRKYAH